MEGANYLWNPWIVQGKPGLTCTTTSTQSVLRSCPCLTWAIAHRSYHYRVAKLDDASPIALLETRLDTETQTDTVHWVSASYERILIKCYGAVNSSPGTHHYHIWWLGLLRMVTRLIHSAQIVEKKCRTLTSERGAVGLEGEESGEVSPSQPTRGLGERRKLQRGLGHSPNRNGIWYTLAIKSSFWWQFLRTWWREMATERFKPRG